MRRMEINIEVTNNNCEVVGILIQYTGPHCIAMYSTPPPTHTPIPTPTHTHTGVRVSPVHTTAEEVDMIESEGTRGVGGAQGGGAIYDEDEEDEGVGGAQRVGCSQQ